MVPIMDSRLAGEVAIILMALAATVLAGKYFLQRSQRHPLPPGPKPFPILGNLLDLPNGHHWIHFHKWSQLHGKTRALPHELRLI
jgi:hypothetical protein